MLAGRAASVVKRRQRLSAFARVVLIVCALTGGWIASPDRGLAQTGDHPREVLLGTVTTGSVPSRERTWAAAQLLAEGFSSLERGDIMLGRRHLEMLVEAYPETLSAKTARSQLEALYADRRDGGAPGPGAGRELPRWLPPEHDVPAAVPGDDGRLRPRLYREAADQGQISRQRHSQDERRLQTIGHEFQTIAGDRVFFAETSADLGARARTVLAAQARWIAGHAGLEVTIEAHADDHQGDRERDTTLAQRRGQAVRERLIEEGVDPGRITVRAYGRDRPVATCNSPECAAQNRRVVTRVGGGTERDTEAGRRLEAPAFATGPLQSRRRGMD